MVGSLKQRGSPRLAEPQNHAEEQTGAPGSIHLLELLKGEAGEEGQKPILGSQRTPKALLERILKYLSFTLPVPNAGSSVLSVSSAERFPLSHQGGL